MVFGRRALAGAGRTTGGSPLSGECVDIQQTWMLFASLGSMFNVVDSRSNLRADDDADDYADLHDSGPRVSRKESKIVKESKCAVSGMAPAALALAWCLSCHCWIRLAPLGDGRTRGLVLVLDVREFDTSRKWP